MKNRDNRHPVDTLYILGAGSSRALTHVKARDPEKPSSRITPIDSDFLSILYKRKLQQGWQKRARECLEKDWLGSDPLTEFGLEKAVIERVADFELLKALHPSRIKGKCKNEEYLNNLIHLVSDYLIKCRSNNSGDTREFVNHVFPVGESPNSYKNRIITFNYDLIVDRPLLERGISKKKLYFDKISPGRDSPPRRKRDEIFKHPLLLKLHGSVNWRCERHYFNQIVAGSVDNKTERFPIWSFDVSCPSPEDDESILIIPPVPNKPVTRVELFRTLWTSAMEYLNEAKKIVIVGYSCPETDALARSMFTQFINKGVSEIYVVDPSAEAMSKYYKLFRKAVNKNVKWHYSSDFREYIENYIRVAAAS